MITRRQYREYKLFLEASAARQDLIQDIYGQMAQYLYKDLISPPETIYDEIELPFDQPIE